MVVPTDTLCTFIGDLLLWPQAIQQKKGSDFMGSAGQLVLCGNDVGIWNKKGLLLRLTDNKSWFVLTYYAVYGGGMVGCWNFIR